MHQVFTAGIAFTIQKHYGVLPVKVSLRALFTFFLNSYANLVFECWIQHVNVYHFHFTAQVKVFKEEKNHFKMSEILNCSEYFEFPYFDTVLGGQLAVKEAYCMRRFLFLSCIKPMCSKITAPYKQSLVLRFHPAVSKVWQKTVV